MTAPGDLIGDTQGLQVGDNVGHGADPDDFAGTIRLDTGNKENGELNIGKDSHGAVFEERSDAWKNLLEVLNGGTVTTYREPAYEDLPIFAEPGTIPQQSGWKTPGDRLDIS